MVVSKVLGRTLLQLAVGEEGKKIRRVNLKTLRVYICDIINYMGQHT